MASAYIPNRCFNDRVGKTTYEAITGLKPNLNKMRMFGMLMHKIPKSLNLEARKEYFWGLSRVPRVLVVLS